jgi:hypothetical protein
MTDAQASEAGRSLARSRWGDSVVRRAAGTLLDRAELTPGTRAEIEQLAEEGTDGK